MTLYQDLVNKKTKLSLIGLGYVGMPIAVAFDKKGIDVIGYDYNAKKVEQYKNGIDPTNEVGNEEIKKSKVHFTNDPTDLKDAKFHIVAVPTPINPDKTPNLDLVKSASVTLGRVLTKGSIVVYESTVYPGVTEEICITILEKESGLKCGVDFKVGYSPERINPGDKVHRLENIIKIVSGMDNESLEEIAKIYEIVIEAGVHKVSSIRVAEAAKVVENSQRDINIAFMNELALVFDKMNIDSQEVVDAMNTKWNALGFTPGLVGGHCIGIDPYYFVYEAERLGYNSQIITQGRKVNDKMGEFIATSTVKKLIEANKRVKEARVTILGLSFKENTPDTRNSKVVDVYDALKEYGLSPVVVDPVADKEEARSLYNIEIQDLSSIDQADCVILAVQHDEFKKLTLDDIDKLFIKADNKEKVLIDIKSILNKAEVESRGYTYWRL